MSKWPVTVLPSIMAADIGHLADEAKRIEAAGADGIHIDVMDAHFVPNLAFSPQSVAAIRRSVKCFLEVHLMMYNPYDYIEAFVKAGAQRIIFHFEATEDVEDTLNFIRRCNVQAGLAFCPETADSLIPRFLQHCDLILLMTVNPGFGGQDFIPEVLPKIQFVRDMCEQMGIREGGKIMKPHEQKPPFLIEVDGGIDFKTGKQCQDAGANVIVSGSFLFEQKDIKQAVVSLKEGGIQ